MHIAHTSPPPRAGRPACGALPPDPELARLTAAFDVTLARLRDAGDRLEQAVAEHRALLRDILGDYGRGRT